MSSDRTGWSVKDEALHEELASLIGLTAEETAALAGFHEAAKAAAPTLTDAFYNRLTSHPNTGEFFAGVDMGRMHRSTGAWFSALFAGRYDAAYVKERLHIGQVHVRIGLPVRYPLAMLDLISEHGERVAAQNAVAMRAFRKVLALDVAIFNQAYEDDHLRHLAELVGGERLARRLLTGEQ